jgi:hypothetical protein
MMKANQLAPGLAPPEHLASEARPNSVWGEMYEESAAAAEYRGEELAVSLLSQLFRRYPDSLAIRLWNGDTFSVGAAFPLSSTEAPFVLVFHHPRAVSSLVLGRDPLRLERAHYRGEVDIEGDLLAALALKDHLKSMRIPFQDGLAAIIKAMRLRNLNPRQGNGSGGAYL